NTSSSSSPSLTTITAASLTSLTSQSQQPPAAPAPKRRGRPPGSKNKPKVPPLGATSTTGPLQGAGRPKLAVDNSFFASAHLSSLSYSDEEDNRLVGGHDAALQRQLLLQQQLQQQQQSSELPVKKKRGRPRSIDRLN